MNTNTKPIALRTILVLALSLLLLPMAVALTMTLDCPVQANAGAQFQCTLDYTLNSGETLAGIDFQLSGENWIFGTPTTSAGLLTYNPSTRMGSVASARSFTAHPLLTIPVTAPSTPQSNTVKISVTAYDENSVSSTVTVRDASVQVLGAATAGLGDSCDPQIAAACSGDLTCSDGTCKQPKSEAACVQDSHCVSSNCDDGICCAVNEENVAGECVLNSDIDAKAGEIASTLRDNNNYPTLLRKLVHIAGILRGLLGLS